jgi:hypothetical protein
MSEDAFIAELLRRYPELRVETLPNGQQAPRVHKHEQTEIYS